ncbi:MAG: GDYXXLXY domain-containing protein [Alphaproteobacteria bacterium]|nr:GDYXXLXY domain-containing protein [Alphaproteobacteria bacterium]
MDSGTCERLWTKWKHSILILALILPIFVPAALAIKAHLDIRGADIYRIPITGYDPRDMLRGHYLVFRFDWPWADNQSSDFSVCQDATKPCCVCLSGDHAEPKAHLQMCPPRPTSACPAPMRGYPSFEPGQFDIGISQFYVPEDSALYLENLLREGKATFKLGLISGANGKPIIETLYVNGQPLKDYLTTQDHTEE